MPGGWGPAEVTFNTILRGMNMTFSFWTFIDTMILFFKSSQIQIDFESVDCKSLRMKISID